MAFPVEINGHPGLEKEHTSSKKRRFGTKLVLPDGRMYSYGKAGEAITAGKITMAAATTAAHIKDLAIAAAVAANASGIGAITVTNQTTAISGSAYYTGTRTDVGDYEDGYIFVNDVDGEGQYWPIWRHSAATSSGTLTVDLFENDFVATALTTSSQIGLAKNPWSEVEAWDVNDIDGPVMGIPNRDMTSGYYGWFQTQGPCAVLTNGTLVVGNQFITGSSTDGSVDVAADNNSAEIVLGDVINVGATTEYSLVWLRLGK
jgi:hypothetical protein